MPTITLSKFQNRICNIATQETENKTLLHVKLRKITVTVGNSKPKRDNAVIRIKFVENANLFKTNVNFFRFCSEETGEIV